MPPVHFGAELIVSMFTRILDNFWLKLTAIALALLIWLHVATDKEYNYRLQLPLTGVTLSDSLTLATNPPESLEVSVTGTGKQLLRKKWRDRGLRLNAVGLQTGRHEITATPDNTSLVGAVGDIVLDNVLSPNQILLDIDRLSEAEVPVTPAWIARADDGFAIRTPVRIDPPTVTISGPRSVLRRIRSVETEPRQLEGLRDDLSISLALVPPTVYGVGVFPDSVQVLLDVVAVKTRTFDAIPVRAFNSPTDQEVAVFPALIRVELTGPPGDIDDIEPTAVTASTDFRERSESGRAAVKVDCPPAFRIRSVSVDSVTITVRENADTRN